MENMSGSMNEKMISQEHDTERTINKKDNKAKNEALTYIRDYRVMTNLKYRLITNILILGKSYLRRGQENGTA